ncbi:MAG TPA: carbonic anhydrase, partial [Patescibacteria group bacterium]|nr:carbonic anhydrase [Patescibacteria group bacterium]
CTMANEGSLPMTTPLTKMHHCDFVFVRCMDFRQTHDGAIRDFVASRFPRQECDLVSLAGAVRILTEGKNAKPILDSIGIGLKAHGARTVVLMNHTNCGYYAASGITFKSAADEEEVLTTDLRCARKVVLNKFHTAHPNVKVLMFLAVLSDKDDTIDFRQIDVND